MRKRLCSFSKRQTTRRSTACRTHRKSASRFGKNTCFETQSITGGRLTGLPTRLFVTGFFSGNMKLQLNNNKEDINER
jgi:hypothetical protein